MQNTFPRQLTNEILDDLAADDPRAIRSRKDLQRINWIMGSTGIVANALLHSRSRPKRILELGAGDGTWMLQLARRLAPSWHGVQVTLLDRQNLVSQQTYEGFARLGWKAELACMDVEDWMVNDTAAPADIGIANLFIHHFDAQQIQALFAVLSKRVNVFVACEPRRSYVALLGSKMVGLVGANEVTRTDAVLSVKAGFKSAELSALWHAAAPGWLFEEGPARLFSHLFVARRRGY